MSQAQNKTQIIITGGITVDIAPIESLDDLEALVDKFADAVDADDSVSLLNLTSQVGRVTHKFITGDEDGHADALACTLLATLVAASNADITLEDLLERLRLKAKKDIGTAASNVLQDELQSRGLLKIAA